MMNIIKWIKRKGWFIFDMPYFIKQQKFKMGLELGAKAGRSMSYMLGVNKTLVMVGIDLWEPVEGHNYKNDNQIKCERKLEQFGDRVSLIKGDAMLISDLFPTATFDFIFYDLDCRPNRKIHEEMISKWIVKIKPGGMLIGRDFRNFRDTFYKLGFKEDNFKKCKIGNRKSTRLEYLIVPLTK